MKYKIGDLIKYTVYEENRYPTHGETNKTFHFEFSLIRKIVKNETANGVEEYYTVNGNTHVDENQIVSKFTEE